MNQATPRKKITMDTTKTNRTIINRTKTTDAIFPQKLRENHVVYGQLDPSQPADFDAIRERLDRDRESMSPTPDDHRRYLQDVDDATNEYMLGATAFLRIKKQPPEDLPTRYRWLGNEEWADVGKISVSRGLAKPKPHYAESLVLDNIPDTVLSSLGPYILPSPYNFSMPRFAVELKGPNGGASGRGGASGWGGTSGRDDAQAAYYGAVMTEAAIAQEKYLGNNQSPYGKTQAITATFEGGNTLSIQANHAIKKDINGTTEYHNSVLFNDVPVASKEQFKAARRHFRNSQDWARERSGQTLQRIQSRPGSDLTPVDELPVLEPKVSRSKRSKLSHH